MIDAGASRQIGHDRRLPVHPGYAKLERGAQSQMVNYPVPLPAADKRRENTTRNE